MTAYRLARVLWTTLLSRRARRLIWRITPRPLQRWRSGLIGAMERRADHDEIYDADYYAQYVEPTMAGSCRMMAQSIMEEFKPGSVIDIGCGTGQLLETLAADGVDVRGLECSRAAFDACRRRGIDVSLFDIERDEPRPWTADVVISTEVAEHLPASCADRFVDLLTSMSDRIVMTAAYPGQGGTDHVNEQPNEYWIERFAKRGFRFDRALSECWRARWRAGGVAACYARTLMVFRREHAMRLAA